MYKDVSKTHTFILENLKEDLRSELTFLNPFSEDFKKKVKYYNSICDELDKRGEFNDN